MIFHEYISASDFEFEAGGSIGSLKIAYHTSSALDAGDSIEPLVDTRPVIWICHALTANSDPSDWWPSLVGSGKLFDTDRYFVVCVNMLGSAYGSSGPSSENPVTARPYYFDFPKITVRDIVRAHILIRKHLGIEKIDLLVGGSIGGFQAVEWAVMEPDVIKRAVFIACNAKVSPWLTAWNESQRLSLEADPTFRACRNLQGGAAGLVCARSIALLSYRSYAGYKTTQSEQSEDFLFAERAASYQRYQGKKLADRFDAYSYYYLTFSVDSHDVGRGRGGLEKALTSIRADCIVIGIDSDGLFPVAEQRFLAEGIPRAEFREISSEFGHDGFLLENAQLTNIIKPILCKF